MYKVLISLLLIALVVGCGGPKKEPLQKTTAAMEFQAAINTVEPMTVATIAKVGPYKEYGKTLAELVSWIMANKVNKAAVPFGVYYDDPSKVTPESTRYEVGIQIAPEAKSDKQVTVKNLPAMEVASTIHFGPYNTVSQTYGKLAVWISQKGYEIAGPAREFYHSNPATVPAESLRTELQFPVVKKVQK